MYTIRHNKFFLHLPVTPHSQAPGEKRNWNFNSKKREKHFMSIGMKLGSKIVVNIKMRSTMEKF